jgi:hypothetical protein
MPDARNDGKPSQPPKNNPKGDPPTRPARQHPPKTPPPPKTGALVAALLAVLACLTLAGCDPEGASPTGPKHEKPPAATAGAGERKHEKPPTAGPEAKHETDPGEIDLHVEWISENAKSPACEWSLNKPGVHEQCSGVGPGVQEPGEVDYIGLWEYTVLELGHSGDTVELYAEGNIGAKSIRCYVAWKNRYHELPYDDSKRRCGGSYKLN